MLPHGDPDGWNWKGCCGDNGGSGCSGSSVGKGCGGNRSGDEDENIYGIFMAVHPLPPGRGEDRYQHPNTHYYL